MSKTTKIIIVSIIAIVLIYVAYKMLLGKNPDAKTSSVSIDCSKYWSLNSIDKQYCKNNGMAPAYTATVNSPSVPVNQVPVSTSRVRKVL